MAANGNEVVTLSQMKQVTGSLTGKADVDHTHSEYATVTYVDQQIGDINAALDAINGEVI